MASTTAKKACGKCGALEDGVNVNKFSACGRCGLEFYCSKDCQRAHWAQGDGLGHRPFCVAKNERAPLPPWVSPEERGALAAEYAARVQHAATSGQCAVCLEALATAGGASAAEAAGSGGGSDSDADDDGCPHQFHPACVAALQAHGLCSSLQSVCPVCNRAAAADELPLKDWPAARSFEVGCRRHVALSQKAAAVPLAWAALPPAGQREADEVLRLWRDAASPRNGHAGAQFALGQANASGALLPVKKHANEALAWHYLAAAQGHAGAWTALGQACSASSKHSSGYAVGCWRRAAAGGDAEGSFRLGCALSVGLGVPKDLAEAAKWHRAAAEQGHADAAAELGQVSYE
jgi:hypothetical protein